MKRIILLSLIVLAYFHSRAQGIAITTDNTDPHASAMLDVKSNNKGLLPPRMTEAQKKAIHAPANGLIIFQTDGQKGLYIFEESWKPLSDQLGKHLATENLRLGGYRLSNTDTTVGISIDEQGAVRFKTKYQNTNPLNRFQFDPSGAITSNGKLSEGSLPATGAGARFMWYPGKAALRAGALDDASADFWNEANIGRHSVALGFNNIASGIGSIALGSWNSSTSMDAIAIGSQNQISGQSCVGIGDFNTVRGGGSAAIGQQIKILSPFSYGLGINLTATPNSIFSVLLGSDLEARNQGCMMLGDGSGSGISSSTADHQFISRFIGGYQMYSNARHSTGVTLAPNSNAWSILSDSTKKEKFLPANGEDMLGKLRKLKMGSWNYKGIPQRHYGPMAQEFFAAYGKDQYGTIGNDTTINQADMEGVMMILIHALEERTNVQKQEISSLKQTNAALQERLTAAEEQSKKIDQLIALLKKNDATKALVTQLEAGFTTKATSCCEK